METAGSFMFFNALVGASSWTLCNSVSRTHTAPEAECGKRGATYKCAVGTFSSSKKCRYGSIRSCSKAAPIHPWSITTIQNLRATWGPREDEKAGQYLLSSAGFPHSDSPCPIKATKQVFTHMWSCISLRGKVPAERNRSRITQPPLCLIALVLSIQLSPVLHSDMHRGVLFFCLFVPTNCLSESTSTSLLACVSSSDLTKPQILRQQGE